MSTPFDTLPLAPTTGLDEDPLSDGGRWANTNISVAFPLRRTAGNFTNANNPAEHPGEMLWTPEFWTDAAVCFVFEENPVGYGMWFKLRSTSDGATSYYRFVFGGPSASWHIFKRVSGGAETDIGNAAVADLTTGDRFGAAAIGTSLTMWRQQHTGTASPSPLNTNWTQVVSATDSALTSGYYTLGISGVETEMADHRAAGVFPVGGGSGGGGSASGPGSPTFNVRIRSATSRP